MKKAEKAMKSLFALFAAGIIACAPLQAQNFNQQVQKVFPAYLPGTTGFAKIKVDKVTINDQAKTVAVKCNEEATYIPLTEERLAALKADVLKALPEKYSSYKVSITAGKENKSLDDLTLFAKSGTLKAPSETERFVTPLNVPAAPQGMEGSNIALWQSHGWYFEPKLNRWEWQRARVMQTVEDLYTQSYVMPFLMPMLENAGAYVMSPRERDTALDEIIIDNDATDYTQGSYKESNGKHSWAKTQGKTGFANTKPELHNGDNPFRQGTSRMVKATADRDNASTAAWNAEIPTSRSYAVYVSYTTLPNSAKDAVYTIHSAAGDKQVKVNQQMGGGTWIYLGHYPFEKGLSDEPLVELANISADGEDVVITADAVKIGGGMGNVARIVKEPLDKIDYKYVLSGYPRFTEGARYWLQWAGAPDSVYTPSDNVNDYTDDYRSRGLWVNWIAGGSSVLPDREGLKVPIDLSLAFHSDAGTTLNDSIIGTLGIYCTKGDVLGSGASRLNSRDYTDLVMTEIVNDIRAGFEPNWTRRGMWDQSYYEARVPEVPAMLLELLSHQNFADMKYGLDPTFRFTVSRAIYKAMLKFLAHRDGRDYVVQPLPVRKFAINNGAKAGSYTLTWQPTDDKQEATATPTYYIVEERIGQGAFMQATTVTEPKWEVTATDNEIHSYRIIAGNDGGISFPSEVLAFCYMPGAEQVSVVNGFTRVSAPDWFDSGEIAGFYDIHDHGVPYIQDISFIGSQFEFRRHIPWMDDDAAGFGASRANFETEVVAGNTFDYVYTHGDAIRQAGFGFISSSVEAFADADTSTIAPIVDFYLGKQKETQIGRGAVPNRFKTFPSDVQAQIRKLTGEGKSFFISGAYVASDLWDNPYSSEAVAEADQKFASEVLGYNWRVDQASVTGEVYQVPSRFPEFTEGEYAFSCELGEDFYATESPDSLYPSDDSKGATIMRYRENNLIAGTATDAGGYRTVVIGFPFETIFNPGERASLMSQVLKFLSKK